MGSLTVQYKEAPGDKFVLQSQAFSSLLGKCMSFEGRVKLYPWLQNLVINGESSLFLFCYIGARQFSDRSYLVLF